MTDLPPAPPGPQWGPPPAPVPPGYGVPGATYPYARTESMAVASLVLGIVSFLVCPVVAAVVALALGYGARSRIESSGGTLKGEGLALAGLILGWVNISLATVGVWLGALALASR